MKVWLINHYAVSDTDPGGTRHYTLAKELRNLGHESTVIASGFDHNTHRDKFEGSTERLALEEINGVPFLWIRVVGYTSNSSARTKNMLQFGYRAYMTNPAKLVGKPDVIIGSSPHPFAALAGLRLAKKYKVPFVLEVRDLWPESLVELGGFSATSPTIKALAKLEKYLYTHATRIISLMPNAKDFIEARGGKGKVVWIANGIDVSNASEQIARQPEGEFIAMFAGAHGPANGLDVVLDAAKLAPAIKFRFMGGGPLKAHLVERAKTEGISNVEFRDPVPKTQVQAALAEAGAFIMHLRPSPVFKWGISPNKLWDYMLAGRPTVFAVTSSNNPILDADAGLCIPPDDPQAMADALVQLSKEPAERRMEMGKNGREYVLANHDFKMLATKLANMLKEIVPQR